MSARTTVESFTPIEIKITCIDKKSVCEIEEAAICAVKQKLDKLNIIFKNLSVYCHDNLLLINDRYGICKDLEEIASAFGLNVQAVQCGLRGKSYIVEEPLIKLINATNSLFSVSNYANSQITSELISVIEKSKTQANVKSDVSEILKEIKEKGYYSLNGKQKVTSVYDDAGLIKQEFGEIVSDEAQLSARLKNYMTEAKSTINKANENLRDGTAKLLYSRARQMGYAVQEERNGNQVQLVLVRCG
ncbi:MAG: hypothetical protein K2K38_04490 [Clostridia bacterium]|nr:hypothetical protein [Clostridia bacterium]